MFLTKSQVEREQAGLGERGSLVTGKIQEEVGQLPIAREDQVPYIDYFI